MADMECPMSVSNLISSPLICLHTEISDYLYYTVQEEHNIKSRLNRYDERLRITIVAITIGKLDNRCEQTMLIIITLVLATVNWYGYDPKQLFRHHRYRITFYTK